MLVVGAIALVGNVSAVRRLLHAARVASAREDTAPISEPEPTHAPLQSDEVRR